MTKTPDMEVSIDEIILDEELYTNIGARTYNDPKDFNVGDSIIYFRTNNTWRAEVIKKLEGVGYIVSDY